MKFVDYTPQLAIFFDELTMSMAKIAKQFYEFFGNEEHIELINNANLSPLLDFK